MPNANPSARQAGHRGGVQVVPREYAGKWLAWSADGRRIVAVGDSFEAAERAATEAGFPPDRVAIDRAPTERQRQTGSGT